MSKLEKTMIVIVDKLGYVVPASIVVALKRRFDTVRVRELGMEMDSARGFVRERVVGKIRYQHTLAVPERDRFNRHLDPDAVLRSLRARCVRLHYLSLTKGGHPGHPLYLPKDSRPKPWAANLPS